MEDQPYLNADGGHTNHVAGVLFLTGEDRLLVSIGELDKSMMVWEYRQKGKGEVKRKELNIIITNRDE